MSDISRWHLSNEEMAVLLGGSTEFFGEIQQKAACELSIDIDPGTIERISLLLGIWKTIQVVAPNGRLDLAYNLFNQKNTSNSLGGLSIKEYLLQHKQIKAYYDVLRYLPQVVT